MRPITVTVGPLAVASASNIAQTQTPGAAGPLTLNGTTVVGGVAVLDTPRRVLWTTTGNEVGKTLVLVGTTFGGQVATETLAGVNNSTVASVLDYASVASANISAAAAAAMTLGTNGVAGSSWVRMDDWALASIALQVNVTGTLNYTVQQSVDDPNSPTNPVTLANMGWVNSADANVVSATARQQSVYSWVPTFVRIVLNSQTNPASASMTVQQVGVNPK